MDKEKSQDQEFEIENEEESELDFGGLPKDVPFTRNLGCGG